MIEYQSIPSSEPSKYNLLIIHGFMGDGSDFIEMAANIHRKFPKLFDIYLIHLPFHNPNGSRNFYGTWPQYNENLQWFITNLKKPCVLYGYSMGGRVALTVSQLDNRNINGLILESSSFGLSNLSKKLDRWTKDKGLFAFLRKCPVEAVKENFGVFLESWYNLPLFKNIKNSPKYQELYINRLCKDPNRLHKGLLFFSLARMSYFEFFESKTILPTLYLSGEWDEKYNNLATTMVKKSNNINFHHKVINNASHNCHFMNQESVLEKLNQFFNRYLR